MSWRIAVRAALALALCGAALIASSEAAAHEFRPTLLRADIGTDGVHRVTWKWDGADPRGIGGDALEFPGCEFTSTDASVDNERMSHFRVTCGEVPLSVAFATPPVEVVLDIRRDGTPVLVRHMLGVERVLDLDALAGDAEDGAPMNLLEWGRVGVEHIVFGWDHLCFVLGLAFLLHRWRRVAVVITGFTLGHSVTLVGATMQWLPSPASGPVEAVIALSIVYLAVELMRSEAARDRFGRGLGFGVAAAFGLIHGFGFSGALSAFELPPGAEIPALAAFNIGVEVGQLAVVAAALGVRGIIRAIAPGDQAAGRDRVDAGFRGATAYVTGAIGVYWVIERTIAIANS